MKELLITWIYTNPAKVATIVVISTIILAVIALNEPDLTPKQMEEKLKQEILNLDTKRDTKLNDLQKEVDSLVKCRENITMDKGTAEPLKECSEYKESIVPQANAMELTNTWKVDTATPVVAKRLAPSELLWPVKFADDCYVTQTETQHVRAENGGMFATDLACKFWAVGGKGWQAEVYVPDLRGKEVSYIVEYVGYDNLLGSFVQLVVLEREWKQKEYDWWARGYPSDESFILWHTETKFKVGDIVSTGQRLWQMTLNGATTGWNVHFEYRRLSPWGTWASQRYFTGLKEKTLDNKRKNVTFNGWKWGDTIYATSYTLGDVKQNDASPWVWASGKNLKDIPNVVALTKDVRRSLNIKFWDIIVICQWDKCYDVQVEDEMNARYRETWPKDCIKPNNWINACIKMDMARPWNQLPSGEWKLMCKKSECNHWQP